MQVSRSHTQEQGRRQSLGERERRGEREDKDLRGSEVLSGITLIVICGYRLDLAVDIRILE